MEFLYESKILQIRCYSDRENKIVDEINDYLANNIENIYLDFLYPKIRIELRRIDYV